MMVIDVVSYSPQVRLRMKEEKAEEKAKEEAVVKKGLRAEFLRWQIYELNRYMTESVSRAQQFLDTVNSTATTEVLSRFLPTSVVQRIQQDSATLSSSMYLPLLKLEGNVLSVGNTTITIPIQAVKIAHKSEPFPAKAWTTSLQVRKSLKAKTVSI